MTITLLRHEFQEEMDKTRKILSSIPEVSLGWKPHEKSSTLGRLAMHIANNPVWMDVILKSEEYDFNNRLTPPPAPDSKEILMAQFEKRAAEGAKSLEDAKDEDLGVNWTCRQGEVVYFSISREAALRNFSISHLIHHRGQLSVYLRLLDVPVHGMYGPSADGI
jgi:uncharacterized damage-inducible protein DinB